MLKSALYMVRFLINHPESGYDHRTGDFDLLCAIKFFQKGHSDTQVAQNKKVDVLKKVEILRIIFFIMPDFSLNPKPNFSS